MTTGQHPQRDKAEPPLSNPIRGLTRFVSAAYSAIQSLLGEWINSPGDVFVCSLRGANRCGLNILPQDS